MLFMELEKDVQCGLFESKTERDLWGKLKIYMKV